MAFLSAMYSGRRARARPWHNLPQKIAVLHFANLSALIGCPHSLHGLGLRTKNNRRSSLSFTDRALLLISILSAAFLAPDGFVALYLFPLHASLQTKPSMPFW